MRVVGNTRRRQPSLSLTVGNSLIAALLFLVHISAGLISPPLSAERVVREQLDALKDDDIRRAYALYSPDSQDAMGGCDSFSERVYSSPFETLVNHKEAQVLMTSQIQSEDVCGCLVKIEFAKKWRKKYRSAPCLYFLWELSREDEDSPWQVDAFMPDFDDMDFEAFEVGDFDIDGEDGDMLFEF
jgi:hypothetical protein